VAVITSHSETCSTRTLARPADAITHRRRLCGRAYLGNMHHQETAAFRKQRCHIFDSSMIESFRAVSTLVSLHSPALRDEWCCTASVTMLRDICSGMSSENTPPFHSTALKITVSEIWIDVPTRLRTYFSANDAQSPVVSMTTLTDAPGFQPKNQKKHIYPKCHEQNPFSP
jgi:hypothetical protein